MNSLDAKNKIKQMYNFEKIFYESCPECADYDRVACMEQAMKDYEELFAWRILRKAQHKIEEHEHPITHQRHIILYTMVTVEDDIVALKRLINNGE